MGVGRLDKAATARHRQDAFFGGASIAPPQTRGVKLPRHLSQRAGVWGIVLLLLAAVGCRSRAPKYNYRAEPDPTRGEFVLGPADELRITVWRNSDLSTSATIRPDGTITMPLIGDIPAAGRTTRDVREEIRRLLRDYVKEGAVVTVALTRVNSYRFTVAGKVARVGLYHSPRFVTVSEAIAMAGGPTRFADAGRVRIVRRDPSGKLRRIPIDYQAIAAGKKRHQNLVILPGDTVYIP
jgi:polysaccharide export outer membrane protein